MSLIRYIRRTRCDRAMGQFIGLGKRGNPENKIQSAFANIDE